MTSTLLLLLKGPLQSWGDESRFTARATRPQPTKSGVLGLVAAAEGRRRADDVEDLAALKFAVRVDQPGSVLKDFQTAEDWQTGGGNRLVSRYFLSDAVFVAAIESPNRSVLEGIESALKSPRFPLFLGRRSCPANFDLVIGIKDVDAVTALREEPWRASESHRRTRSTTVELPIFRDGAHDEAGGEQRHDVPVSFSQEHRQYDWRVVVQEQQGVVCDNPEGQNRNDPFFETVMSA